MPGHRGSRSTRACSSKAGKAAVPLTGIPTGADQGWFFGAVPEVSDPGTPIGDVEVGDVRAAAQPDLDLALRGRSRGRAGQPQGRRSYCSDACRTAAWRRRINAPTPPKPAKADIIYQCPSCETRYLGQQRCDDCNLWCKRIGLGSSCPHCEPLAINDLLTPDQFTPPLPSKNRTTQPTCPPTRARGISGRSRAGPVQHPRIRFSYSLVGASDS